MIKNILDPTALPYRETRFPKPPAGAYVVYMDDVTTDGPDGQPRILTHGLTLELYAPAPDALKTAEAKIETELTTAGTQWTKQAAYWLQTEQLYQTVYEFEYIEKRRT